MHSEEKKLNLKAILGYKKTAGHFNLSSRRQTFDNIILSIYYQIRMPESNLSIRQ